MAVTFKFRRVPEENAEHPAAFEFELQPGQQVAVVHEQRPSRDIDPETGLPIMEVVKTFVRVYMTDDNAKDVADAVRRDAPTRG
jgi:hypothetical protein